MMASRTAQNITKWIDRAFIALQALAGTFQLIGTFMFTELWSNLFAWSLSAVLVPAILVALNILRHRRGGSDRAIAIIAMSGNIAWMVFILLFGKSQGNLLDPRIVMHALAAFGLAILGERAIAASAATTQNTRPA